MPSESLPEKAKRYGEDIGHAIEGNFERISEKTKREVAEGIKDRMEGRSRVEYRINERVTVGGYRKKDGTVGVTLKIDF